MPSEKTAVLVTGGLGYIGSHTCVALAEAGYRLVVTDNLSNSKSSVPATLRYFNPIGAHPSGRIGEDPNGIPNNLLPYVAQVAVGRRRHLRVWGRDYSTPDGTGVRDYIHVMDLAQAHVAALKYLGDQARSITVNVGTGRGYSVLEVVKAFEGASGKPIALEFHPRRPGDVASY